MNRRHIRYYIFLKDVLSLALTAFGGPQAHIALYLNLLVQKRRYITEEELIELNALCSILPGPTSTQTLAAVGYKLGGPKLAYLTLLLWILPAMTLMIFAALSLSYFQETGPELRFARFIMPMAVGIVAYSGLKISQKVIKTKLAFAIMAVSAIVSFIFHSPYLFPVQLLTAGLITSLSYKKTPSKEKQKMHIKWANFILWLGVLLAAGLVGYLTKDLTVRVFENFYRNGSLIFGGGQVLVPLLYSEYVELKHYLTSDEFLTGYGLVQAVPGPVFSFSAFLGALTTRDSGTLGQIFGGIAASAGIFLPGIFLIFFVIRFWDELKKYRPIRCSLEGINAASSGMVIAAVFLLSMPMEKSLLNISLAAATFCLLNFTKMPAPVIILAGLLFGFIL